MLHKYESSLLASTVQKELLSQLKDMNSTFSRLKFKNVLKKQSTSTLSKYL